MKKIAKGRKRGDRRNCSGAFFFLSPDKIYTGYVNWSFHHNLYKLNKMLKNK